MSAKTTFLTTAARVSARHAVISIATLFCAAIAIAGEPYLIDDLSNPDDASDSSFFTSLEPVGDQVVIDFPYGSDPLDSGRDRLWVTDGTAAGTRPMEEPPGVQLSGAKQLSRVDSASGEALYFTAYDPTFGAELRRWDGSGPPSTLELEPGEIGANPHDLTPAGEQLYFTRRLDGDLELWRLNAGGASATFLTVLRPGSSSSALGSATLEKSEKSEKGPYFSAPFQEFHAFGDRVAAFVVTDLDDDHFVDPEDEEWLWASDGTPAGTTRLKRVTFLSGTSLWHATPLDETLLFFSRADDGHAELWRTDGTPAGTELISRFDQQAEPLSASFLISHRGYAYFGFSFDSCVDLWRTDGASVEKLDLGCVSRPFSAGGQLFFMPSNWGPTELYRLVSEPPRVEQVFAFNRGNGPSSAFRASSPGVVYFIGHDEQRGRELWRSDGTPEGTRPIGDIAPGPEDTTIGEVELAKRQLIFTANDGIHGRELWAAPLSCVASSETLCLGGGRFQVRVRWSDPQGSFGAGLARTRPLTEESGAFYFFDEANIELAVKVLDGRELTGTFWVFYASLSNVEFELEVLDTETGELAVYQNPAGTMASVGDTEALPAIGTSKIANYVAGPASSLPSKGLCQPSQNTLCLGDGRFRVTAAWQDFEGGTGNGVAGHLSDDTGTFWFFDEQNVELLIKILDGTDFNGHQWVFYASLSNVEFSVTVEDLETGQQKTYRNPAGTFASQADTEAF